MTHLLSEAGRSFLRAFGASILVLAPGVLAAPDLNGATALGIAAIVASIAAGLKSVQVFIPRLSFDGLIVQPYAAWVDSFARAFLAAFATSLIGILALPDYSAWRSAGIAAVVGAVTAGLRALQGLLTPGERPAPATGLRTGGASTTGASTSPN